MAKQHHPDSCTMPWHITQQRHQFEAYLATVQPASSQEFDAILAEADEAPEATKIPPALKEAFNALLD